MIPWWWSWLLTAVGITGLWAAGSRKTWGWLVGLGAQALWIAYAITSHQWGFILSAIAYGIVYARNAYTWTRTARTIVVFQCLTPDCGHVWEGRFIGERRMPPCPACGQTAVMARGVRFGGAHGADPAPVQAARPR